MICCTSILKVSSTSGNLDLDPRTITFALQSKTYYMAKKFRKGKWSVINIKARHNQHPAHYVDAICKIPSTKHAYENTKGKYLELVHVEASEWKEADEAPVYLILKIIKYERIEGDFYDRDSGTDIPAKFPPNIFANKQEAEAYFIPSIHKLVVKSSECIKSSLLVKMLTECLNTVEREGFDVDTVKDRAAIERIINAHCILSIEADVSYSNPGNFDGFQALLDTKLKESNTRRAKFALEGSEQRPLQGGENSLIEAIAQLSEENGTLKAKIKEEADGRTTFIDTSEHPRVLEIEKSNSLLELVNRVKNFFL